jgi:hypothetical protein
MNSKQMLLAGLAALALAGCGASQPVEESPAGATGAGATVAAAAGPGATAEARAEAGPTPAAGDKALMAARDANRSPGKPRPPVQVSLAPGQLLQSGVPGTLAVHVHAPAGIEVTRMEIEGDAGIGVLGLRRAVQSLEAGQDEISGRVGAAGGLVSGTGSGAQELHYALAVTPISGGNWQLAGLVSFVVNGVEQAAPFRLTVKVDGPQTLPAVAAKPDSGSVVQVDTSGETIYSISAETTVR